VSQNNWDIARVQVERTELNRKILYYFAISAILTNYLLLKKLLA